MAEREVRGAVLALDYGARRIGVAISDPERRFAFPAEPLLRDKRGGHLAALRALAEERGVEEIVIGLPIHLDGRAGPEVEATRAFARALEQETGLDVTLLDERWTTREAERALRDVGVPPGRRRALVDSAAAALLLRTYLERRAAGSAGLGGPGSC